MKYRTSTKMEYKSEEVWFPLSEDILSWDDDFHELMLNDSIRMVKYEKAIKEVIKPGMNVLDVGTGTGILSLWALEAGARKVYGIDVNKDRIPQALKRIEDAGFSEKFEIFNDFSYNVKLPEKVDVIISEILGNLADNEDMTPILNHAKKTFLKENGVILPKKVETSLVPVFSKKAYNNLVSNNVKGISGNYNLDKLLLELEIKDKFNLYYDAILPKSSYLSEPKIIKTFNFENDDSEYGEKIFYKVKKDGFLTGFKGSFNAQLSDYTNLDISSDNINLRETSDCWKHCYLPISDLIKVKKGDLIEVTFSRFYPKKKLGFKQFYSWTGNIKREGELIESFSQSMREK